MTKPSLLTALLASALLASAPCGTASAQPANIVFINADDLGWTDAGFMGSAFYETPNLDRLAASGMVFTEAYAPAANCAPSRASVYTGQSTPRHGVFTVAAPARGNAKHRRLIPSPNLRVLDPSIPTYPKLLQQVGYQTSHIGKWHLGEDPTENGYDVNIGGTLAGHPPGGYFSPYQNSALEDGPEGEYLTDRLGREAAAWIDGLDAERPFLLSMQFYSPHTPIEAPDETVARFKEKPATPLHFNPVYAAMINHLDASVGRILDALERRNLLENTFILFTSDNGGIYNISRQDPLRGEKGSFYEGGVRVPMIVHWPGRVEAGARTATPVTGLDYFPTFLEIAGVEKPADHVIDGDSLVPLVTGTGTLAEDRPLFWHFPFYLQAYDGGNAQTRDILFRTRPGGSLRAGDWKLIEYFEDGALELYNLAHDPGERRNLAESFPEETQRLHQIMLDWREETGAPVPTEPNPQFDAEAEARAAKERMR